MTQWREERDATVLAGEREWLLQMFSGVIHNIGNIVTVAEMTVEEMEEAYSPDNNAVLDMMLEELLPNLRRHQRDGTLAEFLSPKGEGSHYLDSLESLLSYYRRSVQGQAHNVADLGRALQHLSEIALLQQKMLHGLGTEECTALERPLGDAVKMLRAKAARQHIDLQMHCAPCRQVWVDPTIMTQVFINLLKNGLEALGSAGQDRPWLQASVAMSPAADGEMVVCTIEDNGPGIAPDVLPRIFEYGFSTKNQQNFDRGVGLHFSRQAVERFGGRLEVDSTPGRGTRFRVCLPPRDATPAPAPARQRSSQPEGR